MTTRSKVRDEKHSR